MRDSGSSSRDGPGASSAPDRPAVPAHVLALRPYEPGRPIEEVERELGLSDTIKLASNENALGPSPRALEAVRATLCDLHRYPDGGAVMLLRKLADRLDVECRQILLGNGSNEIIELVVRTFVGPGDEVVMSSDAFLIYDLVTRAVDGRAIRVPARGYAHDLEAMAGAVGEKVRVVFIASPNNPTGTIVRAGQWRAFLEAIPPHVVVVCDQAYVEYVDDPDHADPLADVGSHPGVVVLRTFSKIYGLAGLRLGYAVGSADVIGGVARLRQPFNVNASAQVAALAALDDEEHIERSRRLVRAGRALYADACARLGLDFIESHANFVLVTVRRGAAVTQAMLERGVIVRPMDAYGMPDKIRITFGTERENQRCIAALEAVLPGRAP
jgi:histidinol-phosphate aminotransferase